MRASVTLDVPVNSIPIRQNTPEMLRLLRAKSNRYDLAQWFFLTEVIIAVASVIVWMVAMAKPAFAPFAALSGLIGAVITTWVEHERHAKVVEGASVQEIFDTTLFELAPRSNFGPRSISSEDITAWSSDHSAKHHLTDWYAVEIGALPLAIARIACQRANAEWDATMRQRFTEILTIVLVIASVLPLVFATLRDESARTLDLWLFASTPFLYLCYKTIQVNRDVIRGRRQVESRAQGLWEDAIQGRRPIEELEFEARALQDEIYALRQMSAPLFDWAYSLYRSQQELCMRENAKQLVQEYELLERGRIHSSRSPYS